MIIDLSQLPESFAQKLQEVFRKDYELKVLKAVRRQTRVAARNQRTKEPSLNGRGPRTLEIDAMVDSIWRQVYGANYSEDRDLMAFLARRNPEILVRSGGTKIMTGWMPEGGSRRFRKTYAERKAA